MAFKEGEGNQIIFWYDLWSGHLFQKDLYPDLFECAVDKETLVADVLDSLLNKEVRSWNLQFHRAFPDWELEVMYSFYNHIYSKLTRGEEVIG